MEPRSTRSAIDGALRILVAFAIVAIATTGLPLSPTVAAASSFSSAQIDDRGEFLLSDEEWGIFEQLRVQCCEIMEGKRTSTAFDVDMSGIIGDGVLSPEAFGLSQEDIDRYNPFEAKYNITERMWDRIRPSMLRVVWVLQNEIPSIMDWLDETHGFLGDFQLDVRRGESGEWGIQIRRSSILLFVNETCQTDYPFEVSPSGIERIRRSLDNAQAIVDRHAGESPYQRIRSWTEEIDALTTYDHAAAEETDDCTQPLGDAWYFSSVFDNDPSTLTVCVGYSKALRLLFELSGEQQTACHVAWGDGFFQGNNGGHAWSIVRMDDGRNYLVDLTNNRSDCPAAGMFFLREAYGSPETGYTVPMPDGREYVYQYDDLMPTVLKRDALTLSDTPYGYQAPRDDEAQEEPETTQPTVVDNIPPANPEPLPAPASSPAKPAEVERGSSPLATTGGTTEHIDLSTCRIVGNPSVIDIVPDFGDETNGAERADGEGAELPAIASAIVAALLLAAIPPIAASVRRKARTGKEANSQPHRR